MAHTAIKKKKICGFVIVKNISVEMKRTEAA